MGSPQQPTYIIPPPSGPNWKTPLLIGALVLLGASSIFQFLQLDKLRSDTKADMAKLTENVNTSIDRMKIDSSEEVQQSKKNVADLQQRLMEQRRAADAAVGQAKIDAQRRVESLQKQVAQANAEQEKKISEVKTVADTASAGVTAATTDIGNVKTDLGATKSQLENTIATLKKAQGDLDNHTSLIATNAGELKALRELGERNYAEFTINKGKQSTRVADVMIELKKADTKHNRFTISITADDKTVEKKDRTINEPIQFYTSKARQPYEIVVNTVRKDAIVGYLSTPKVMAGRGGN